MGLIKFYQLSLVTAVGTIFSVLATGQAQAYTFTKIADSSNFPPIGICCSSTVSFFKSAAINNQGTVVFGGDLPRDFNNSGNINNPRYGILVGNGDQLTAIADTYGEIGSNIGSILGGEESFLESSPDINDQGTVAFWAYLDTPRSFPFGENGIFISSGGSIISLPNKFIFSMQPVINNQGTLVFWGHNSFSLGNGFHSSRNSIVTSKDGLLTAIAIATPSSNDISSPWSDLSNPTINDEDTVVFNGVLKNGVSGIFISSDGLFTTIADSSGIFNNYFGEPAINDWGTVAFSASLDTGGYGIFTNSGGDITTIFDNSSPFAYPGGIAINNKGNLAFSASLDVGGYGIFTGSDPVADKVIATGDTLFGSKVKGLGFRREGFNDAGQIAFFAELEDGTQGIYRANPDPEAPKSIPEHTSVLGLLGMSVLALAKQRKS
ncbi:MAG TPA: exosortase [Cyanobacteria bacterium UBA11149]|nr:exosortase [Cyanobacteria bacterium UBA11367]HBE59357.1 exosortase [Cyanobacteria bacterium UBA11366]HBK65557.1 exosortase [Cyanobacteria bacterium UBA11166]HBR75401.1 exosortase [Cyanobacteria bacterium UBA11159]HBS70797.1 exosortase [Cyanobacteria bacterium UBA11153]HBW87807.1 exosortase [Cyanobacteria bacterium UBA11149]HCA95833.1 exosortase [Cyanobacteria bacterium UBA9226]